MKEDIRKRHQLHDQIVAGVILAVCIIAAILYFTIWAPNLSEPQDASAESDIVDISESIPETENTELETEPVETSVPELEETIPCEENNHIEDTVSEVQEIPAEAVDELEDELYELELLACVIYQEAGADYICDDCRRRVADVVLNRVADERFPDTMHEVLTQYRQYGRYYWTDVVWPASASYEANAHAVERAYRIAGEVLNGQHSDLYDNGYIWQAEFPQGTGTVYCCGIYFGK